ncbi:MAG: dipeptidase [Bacteroidales bacterium]|nr:dipeptidase [Bacteroidales bacterium]
MENLKNYIETNKERFLNELFNLLRIPSISSSEDHKGDMIKTAELIKQSLLNVGVDKAEVCPTEGNPVVLAEKFINASLPTVVVYGHYDVQPEGDLELWKTPPYEPTIVGDQIYARGANDDKGQLFMHVKALEFMLRNNELPCNVKFMIEGEEEIGSPNLYKFAKENKERLKGDVILVSDTAMIANDIPSIDVGLRGLAYVEVKVQGPNRDLHSGVFGGAVANPLNVLCQMVASLTDENNQITIPGFYDDVLIVSDSDRAEMAKAPFDIDEYKSDLGLKEVYGEKGYTTNERTGIRPSLDLNGIWGGYIKEGAKTVLPEKAHAKISMRLVPNQDPDKIAELFAKHFKAIAPPYVEVEVKPLHGGNAYISPTDSIGFIAASKAMEKTFGVKPIPTRSGGSIPIIAYFEKELGMKSILMGFGLETDAIHSPNEHYGLFNFFKGIETIPYFYRNFTELFLRK